MKRFHRQFKAFCSVLFAVITAVILAAAPQSAALAITASDLYFYSQNHIFFYDPSVRGCGSNTNGLYTLDIDPTDAFNENAIYIMAYLKNAGYSDTSVAAIMGNLKAEGSAFSPNQLERSYEQNSQLTGGTFLVPDNFIAYKDGAKTFSGGFGIAQWTFYTRVQRLQAHADAHFGGQVASIEAQSDYLVTELAAYGLTPEAMNALSIEEATYKIYLSYENPASTDAGYGSNLENAPATAAQLDATRHATALAAFQGRLGFAGAAFSMISDATLLVNAADSTATTEDGENVTIIGDSITVSAEDQIKKLLPEARIIAQVSKQFATGSADNPSGYEILSQLAAEDGLTDIIVIALGTNGRSSVTQDSINQIISLVGPSRTVYFVNNYFYGDPDYYANNNSAISAAADSQNIYQIDWSAAADANPAAYVQPGDVHLTPAGQALFATTIYNALNSHSANSRASALLQCNSSQEDATITAWENDGMTYAFPLRDATKSNYLRNSNQDLIAKYGRDGVYHGLVSALSQPTGWGHHCDEATDASGNHIRNADGSVNCVNSGQYKVDLGIMQQEVDPSAKTDDLWYFSTGATVVAMASGEVIGVSNYMGLPECKQVVIRNDSGYFFDIFYYTHMAWDESVSLNQHVDVGDVIGTVGTPVCTGNGSQAHVHVDTQDKSSDIRPLIQTLYEALPEQ